MIDPQSPLYNTISCYIILIILLLVLKPNCMYCEKKGRFKQFGLEENQTLFSFPIVSICSCIILYILFAFINTITEKLSQL
jgi:hypothetical protein